MGVGLRRYHKPMEEPKRMSLSEYQKRYGLKQKDEEEVHDKDPREADDSE